MRDLESVKKSIADARPELVRLYKVKEIAIFGSYVHGRQRKTSDLDLLVEFSEPISLFDFLRLENLLRETTGIKVDLVMKSALKARIKERVTSEAVYV